MKGEGMTKADLITGFLGSGKTTFLNLYGKWLLSRGQKIGIIENDFGAVNVDMLFLRELEEQGAVTEMVAGGSDLETYRRRFRTKLIALGMQGLDRVLIEPSGVYDADEFFDVLYDDTLQKFYEIGNVIAVVDAKLEENLSEAADYLLVSQLSEAGLVLLSRGEQASENETAKTIAHINRAMGKYGCDRRFREDAVTKSWKEFTDRDFENILSCGYKPEDHIKLPPEQMNRFGSICYMNLTINEKELADLSRSLLSDSSCGSVFRVKGFIRTKDGFLEINANHNGTQLRKTGSGQNVIIIVGEGLKEERISEYFAPFQEKMEKRLISEKKQI